MYINIYTPNYTHMITIQKTNDWKIIFNTNNVTVRAMFESWKIWLTKKEIADVYWVKKSDIKRELNNIAVNSNLDLVENIKKVYNEQKGKKETFYSLDILLALWYRSKHFKETKFLIKINNVLKEYTSSRKYRLNKLYSTPIVNKIIHYFDPVIKK